MRSRPVCYVPRCSAPRALNHLMCSGHWACVPESRRLALYRANTRRGHEIDGTWASWWRAKTAACAVVMRVQGVAAPEILRYEARGDLVASMLEGSG